MVQALTGAYDVWHRLGPPNPAIPDASGVAGAWLSASTEDVLKLTHEHLALSPLLATKLALCLEANEIDGE
jgi:hypothetical protein